MFKVLDKGVKDLVEGCVTLAYYMRGAISYDDLMWRTPFERQVISEFLEKRLEQQSKSPYPVY